MRKPTVGVLSMQRVINYGSFLQAYALKQLIRKQGVDNIEFIDIEKGIPIKGFTPIGIKGFKDKISNIFKTIIYGRLIEKYKSRKFFKKVTKSIVDCWPLLGLNEIPSKESKEYDNVIIGSDEVFNCCQGSPWGFTAQLYGDVKNAKHVSSYAASFGQTTLENLRELDLLTPIGSAVNNLDFISVRDSNSERIIRDITEKPIYRHLDPVLIYGYKEELSQMCEPPISEKYVIVYSYPERITDVAEINKIEKYAKQTNSKIISIFCTYDWCNRYIVPENIFEILRWFKFADCVFTDTFHGTIFAIITHSNFYSIVRQTNKQKMDSLLGSFELESRILEKDSEINEEKIINYNKIESILEEERKQTDAYFKLILDLR